MKEATDFHAIGKYDAACEILMLVRLKGSDKALREVAAQVLKYDPEQCHAKWLLYEQ